MHVANLVKGCPLFHEIYEDEIDQVLQDCIVAHYRPGDKIISQGDTGTEIFVILSGEVDVTVEKDGKEHYITSLQIGDLFGELVLINELERTANIICKQSCDILIIEQEHFFSFFKSKPKLFALMVLNVTRLMTRRLKGANQVIESLNQKIFSLEESKDHKKTA